MLDVEQRIARATFKRDPGIRLPFRFSAALDVEEDSHVASSRVVPRPLGIDGAGLDCLRCGSVSAGGPMAAAQPFDKSSSKPDLGVQAASFLREAVS